MNQMVVVVKAIIIRNGKVLLMRRSDEDQVAAGEWETPGGKIDFGEQLERALIREVSEEAGIGITVEKLMYATTFHTAPDRQIILLSYHCSTDQDTVILSEEHSAYAWADKEQLAQLLPEAIHDDFHRNGVLKIMDSDSWQGEK
ncbi:NUDIX domain-containing protein [Paenibacillus sp. 1011MAR3C5]|uniref:NUDIX hydrolase n=1 Tax=Paenibacillus sp. 1011MAR3C5 TaxID=1675787 RepID=UPI000E6C36D6|nr:NUDIX domain-containing protein [Paenibacillus sp. 1011MAR3C5]RJE90285.1 NUDIX domain-containing protein [Paenibacillus sp. 1011MAR3C5]